jgi:hypothetical protein
MRALHLLFYRPGPDDHWVNHLVTAVAPPFSHCDMQFDNGAATSIYQNESVYIEAKSFSRHNYDRVSITLDEGELERVQTFCDRAYRAKVRFDPVGMILCATPLPRMASRRPTDRTFCSRYLLEALQTTGRPEFMRHDPTTTTPSALYKILREHGKEFIHVSEKRMERVLRQ